MRVADCHPELRHYSKGLCKNCYQREMHRRRAPYLERYAKRGRHYGDPPMCHPDRKHMARGLCDMCYQRWRHQQNPERHRELRRQWSANNRLKRRAQIRKGNLKYKFGITVEQYDAMLVEQNGVCAICGRSERALAKRLAVDHDHNTNVVRGLLCGPCNVVVGYIENMEWLAKANDYLARYRGRLA